MIKVVLLSVIFTLTMATPAAAYEITAPEVPYSGVERMPDRTDSFGEALLDLVQKSIHLMNPNLREATEVCATIVFASLLFSILPIISGRLQSISEIAGVVTISTVIFQHTNSLVVLASDTVGEIFEYGKLLCQVMTAALAAQGGGATSSALYVGTTVFISLLGWLITKIVIPMLYFFLAFAVANCALGDTLLKRTADSIKSLLNWVLKTVMVVFTTYMSITGVVSGATDLAALKSVKMVFSTVVPVVGGILSDSSEAVLTGMTVVKNTAGIYGMLAVLAVFAGPFLRISAHYFMMRISALICGVFGNRRIAALADYLSGAMSILLATVASGCVLVLISTVCFLKGAV